MHRLCSLTLLSMALAGAVETSPYLIPSPGSPVTLRPITTVGESGATGTVMAGIPDGLGAWDNGDGTFTLLMNHELGKAVGAVRAHGATGSFVSKWVISKSTLAVQSIQDLVTEITLFDHTAKTFAVASNVPMDRLCSADLALPTAWFNSVSGKGVPAATARLFLSGEEEKYSRERGFAHIASGTLAGKSIELPYLGSWGFENLLACPQEQDKTIVIGPDDSSGPNSAGTLDGGGVNKWDANAVMTVYVGTKGILPASPTVVDVATAAGLVGGMSYALQVQDAAGNPVLFEDRYKAFGTTTATAGTSYPVALVALGTAGDVSGLRDEPLVGGIEPAGSSRADATAKNASRFLRSEDGAWDPRKPGDFYFVTTDRYDNVKNNDTGTAQDGRSRLWRLRFTDIANPAAGATLTILIDGTENPGPNMMDNLTVDGKGRIVIQEDIGNNNASGRVWLYDIASGRLTVIAKHSQRFGDLVDGVVKAPKAPYSKDEESSGVIDVSSILGDGWFLLDVQAHYATDATTVEGGQLLAMHVPANTGSDATTAAANGSAYLIPKLAGAKAVPLMTVGESVNLKPDGVTPYRMVGLADGLGLFAQGDGTCTLVIGQELGFDKGVVREHGSKGAFVSRWTLDAQTMRVRAGQDHNASATSVKLWSGTTAAPAWTAGTSAFNRFCSADLAAPSAFFNRATGKGSTARLFLAGEESTPSATADWGRAMAHVLSGTEQGTSYELAHVGRQAWENLVACPVEQDLTLVACLDDTTTPTTAGDTTVYNGQVFFYVGTKSATGNEVQKAGLVGGRLWGVQIPGVAIESRETALGAAKGAALPFALVDLGDVAGLSQRATEDKAVAAGVTNFLRPEDGAWDPSHPADFYFATTDRFDDFKHGGSSVVDASKKTGRSRLWRLRFIDPAQPAKGGTITMLIDGAEDPGPQMMDNLAVDRFGRVLIQEDPGNNEFAAKVWMYDIAGGTLTEIFRHDPARFGDRIAGTTTAPVAPFTKDEESSGIIDASESLGAGWYLAAVQAHDAAAPFNDSEIIEGGQVIALYVPVPGDAPGQVRAQVNQSTLPTPAALAGIPASAWKTVGKASGAGLGLINGTLTGTAANGTLTLTTLDGVKVWNAVPDAVFKSVGTPTAVAIKASGHGSAMALVPGTTNEFWLMTDRGPNLDAPDVGALKCKVFPVPAFGPNLLRVRLNADGTLVPLATMTLRRSDGTPLTGLPSAGAGTTAEIAYGLNDDNTINAVSQGNDDQGLDSEGLVAMADGTFWVSDEYGPWLAHFDAAGKSLDRIGPFTPDALFGNTSGYKLPAVLAKRTVNRGMEGLTMTPGGKLVGIMQSGLDKNFNTGGTSIKGKTTPVLRIVWFNPADGTSRQYVYLLEDRSAADIAANNDFPGAVSEIVAESETSFLVLERDGLVPGSPTTPSTLKRIYRIALSGATDISDGGDSALGLLKGGKTIEEVAGKQQTVAQSRANLLAVGITPVTKTLVFDLLDVGGAYTHDKCEGLALAGTKLYVVNDDDFGIVSPTANGLASPKLIDGTSTVDFTQILGIDLAAFGSSHTNVSVTVAADGTVLFRDPAQNPVTANQAPTISPIADQSVVVGTASAALPVTLADGDTAVATLVVSVTSSNTTVLPSSGVVLGGAGGARTVTVTAATAGSATVTITASDGVNLTSRSFAVTATTAGGTGGAAVAADDDKDSSCGVGSGVALGGILSLMLGMRAWLMLAGRRR